MSVVGMKQGRQDETRRRKTAGRKGANIAARRPLAHFRGGAKRQGSEKGRRRRTAGSGKPGVGRCPRFMRWRGRNLMRVAGRAAGEGSTQVGRVA